jgi:hypothetical protein
MLEKLKSTTSCREGELCFFTLGSSFTRWLVRSGRVRSIMGLNKAQGNLHAMARKKVPKWNPPFMARFIVGLCGVLTILFSIVISVAFSHSVLGVGMVHVFDELPSVPSHLPVAHAGILAPKVNASVHDITPLYPCVCTSMSIHVHIAVDSRTFLQISHRLCGSERSLFSAGCQHNYILSCGTAQRQ